MAKAARKQAAAQARQTNGILRYFAPLSQKSEVGSTGERSLASVETVEVAQAQLEDEASAADQPTSRGHAPASQTSTEASGTEDEEETGADTQLPQVSEYERKRLARVAMNAQFLRDLGVATAQREVRKTVDAPRPKKVAVKKRPRQEAELPMVTRRSSRLRGTITTETIESVPDKTAIEDTTTESVAYLDSSVFRYMCSRDAERLPTHDQPQESLVGFRESTDSLEDPNLRKIYSISFSPFQRNALIATGGHQGHVSIYPAKMIGGGELTPLLSFRAHRGWISCLSLARSTPDGRNLLLSAANDGVVKLWDLNQSAGDLPKETMVVEDLHRTGIFGMDVSGNSVLTCSKDSTIALAQLDEDEPSMRVVRRYEEHNGVVKSARFCPANSHTFASGGNDRDLRVYDVRNDRATANLVITDAHSRAINSVVWHPTIEYLLLSSSFDPEMHLYDLRYPLKPLQVLNTASGSGGSQSIFHPCFLSSGRFVVSTGAFSQKKDQLLLQRTEDGSTISCGQLPAKASYIAADPHEDRLLVAMGQRLQFYSYQRHLD